MSEPMTFAAELDARFLHFYNQLVANIKPSMRVGSALRSHEDVCEAYMTTHSDAKDGARIKIAEAKGWEMWMGFYDRELPRDYVVGVEILQLKDRGDFGYQVSRWGLHSFEEIINFSAKDAHMFFIGFSPVPSSS